MAHILYLSIYIVIWVTLGYVMGLSTFNEPFITWICFIILYVKRIESSLYYAARRF